MKTRTILLTLALISQNSFGAGNLCHSFFFNPSEIIINSIEEIPEQARHILKSDIKYSPKYRIPETVIRNHKINEVAEAVVEWVRLQEVELAQQLKRRPDQVEIDLMKSTDIVMFFKDSIFPRIMKNGFLNQHETLSSGGGIYPDYRREIEDSYLGLSLGHDPNSLKLRPKSATINIRSELILGERTQDLKQYGNVAAVFKNEVKKRSLWIAYDSIHVAFAWGPMKNDHSLENKLAYRGTFDGGRISIAKPAFADVGYYEAQIFGELSVRDVDYFLVESKAQTLTLIGAGKPVYLLNSFVSGERLRYEKGILLFDGSHFVAN